MQVNVIVDAYQEFGSGGVSASLRLKNGKRILPKKEVVMPHNGFVGYVAGQVKLYPKTWVRYEKGACPGARYSFEGKFEDFVKWAKERPYDNKTLRGVWVAE